MELVSEACMRAVLQPKQIHSFKSLVMPVILKVYTVLVWGSKTSKADWNHIENNQELVIGDVSGMMTKNVIVFTNGGISYDEKLNTTLDQLYEKLVRLFIFSMKNTDDKRQALNAVAERAHGAHIRLPPATSDNPMYHLRAYFGYLAEMQVRSNRTMPFWTPPYRDYYDIGQIITVVAPAFSKSEPGRFIGVAAIDVLYEELGDPDISEDFEIALSNRPDNGGFIDENTFQSISMTVYNDHSMESCNIEQKKNALCKPDREVDPKQEFLERFCCAVCSLSPEPPTLLIAIGSVFGFVVLFLILPICAIWCWHRRQKDDNNTGTDTQDLATWGSGPLSPPTGTESSEAEIVLTNPKPIPEYSIWTPLQLSISYEVLCGKVFQAPGELKQALSFTPFYCRSAKSSAPAHAEKAQFLGFLLS